MSVRFCLCRNTISGDTKIACKCSVDCLIGRFSRPLKSRSIVRSIDWLMDWWIEFWIDWLIDWLFRGFNFSRDIFINSLGSAPTKNDTTLWSSRGQRRKNGGVCGLADADDVWCSEHFRIPSAHSKARVHFRRFSHVRGNFFSSKFFSSKFFLQNFFFQNFFFQNFFLQNFFFKIFLQNFFSILKKATIFICDSGSN